MKLETNGKRCITKVSTTANHALYANWMSAYCKFTNGADTSKTYTANGSKTLSGYYGTYYWRNTTGKAVTVKVTVKSKLADSTGSSCTGFVYLSSNKTSLTTEVAKATGTTSYATESATVTVPAGKYLLIYNQHNAFSYYTVKITGYAD